MRRIFVPALIVGLLSCSAVGLVGCGETEKEKVEVKKEGPSGSTVQKTETTTTVKGDGGTTPATPK